MIIVLRRSLQMTMMNNVFENFVLPWACVLRCSATVTHQRGWRKTPLYFIHLETTLYLCVSMADSVDSFLVCYTGKKLTPFGRCFCLDWGQVDGAQRRTGKALLFAHRPRCSPLSNLTVQLERDETFAGLQSHEKSGRVLNVERCAVFDFGFLMMLAMWRWWRRRRRRRRGWWWWWWWWWGLL